MPTTPTLDVKTEDQYWAACSAVGLVPRHSAGRISMEGRDCLDLLHRLSTQDLLKVEPGQGARTVLTSDKGRIVDVLTVYRFADRLVLLTSPERQGDVLAWLDRYTFSEDSAASDMTGNTGLIALLGPKAAELAEWATGRPIGSLGEFRHLDAQIAGASVTVARGCEPKGGLHIIIHAGGSVPDVLGVIEETGKPMGVRPVGPAAYEMLRIEAGIGVQGRELGEQYNPLEAQLRDCISFSKGCYIGQEVIARLDTYRKVQKLLVGLLLPLPEGQEYSGEVPSTGAKLFVEGKEAGIITSATFSPGLGRPIALGYVAMKWARPGAVLTLESLKGMANAVVSEIPFVGGRL